MNTEVKQISYKLEDLNTSISLVLNYLECVNLELPKEKSVKELPLILQGLRMNGLENVIDNLEIIGKRLTQYSSELLDLTEAETIQ
ncbi:hypothetical protein [Enterococcus sp. CWB-B31]|uniref:hypothetical protein n=1 Tax=Enterococcus sp. CWB-B31 TaxID=2885159 RepID=UPI001E2B5877|nr:hypothetical protein [Enterococcus sp. CWB-B31]MCB5953979.1 hypothetical protein [Enterococcus sp. CWB-B31]